MCLGDANIKTLDNWHAIRFHKERLNVIRIYCALVCFLINISFLGFLLYTFSLVLPLGPGRQKNNNHTITHISCSSTVPHFENVLISVLCRWYVPLFSLIFLMICCYARIICVANERVSARRASSQQQQHHNTLTVYLNQNAQH